MTMSVWEQRTSQLRKHRQMSSREILFTSPNEDLEPPPTCLHHRKPPHTPTGSLRCLPDPSDPLAIPLPDPAVPTDTSLPVPAIGLPLPEPPLSKQLLEPPEPEPVPPQGSEGKLGVNNHCHPPLEGRRSPRLNGDRRHRVARRIRPPPGDGLSPDAGLRPKRHRHRDAQADGRSTDSPHSEGGDSMGRERRGAEDCEEDERKAKAEGDSSQPERGEAEER